MLFFFFKRIALHRMYGMQKAEKQMREEEEEKKLLQKFVFCHNSIKFLTNIDI